MSASVSFSYGKRSPVFGSCNKNRGKHIGHDIIVSWHRKRVQHKIRQKLTYRLSLVINNATNTQHILMVGLWVRIFFFILSFFYIYLNVCLYGMYMAGLCVCVLISCLGQVCTFSNVYSRMLFAKKISAYLCVRAYCWIIYSLWAIYKNGCVNINTHCHCVHSL